MVPQPFAARGNWLYLDSWAVTDDPRYPGYKAPTKKILQTSSLQPRALDN
jgi:hypothetical protein